MPEVDPLQYILDITENLLRDAGHMSDEYHPRSIPDSPVARQCDDSELGNALLNAYLMGVAHIGATMDFAHGMLHLCRPEIHRYAVFTVGRAAIESSSRAWWLLEPNIPAKERAVRGMRERCRGLRERMRLERGMGESPIPAQRRMIELNRTARRLGHPRKVGPPPDIIDLFMRAFLAAGLSADEGEFSMRQLSGYVHSIPWALYGQMKALDETVAPQDPRVTVRTPSISYGELAYSIHTVATVFSLAFTAQIKAFGWDEQRWRAVWDPSSEQLRQAVAHILDSEV